MVLFHLRRHLCSPCGMLLLLCLLGAALFSACSNSTSTTTTTLTSAATTPSPTTAPALAKLISLIGQPTAKIVAGTTFEVDGMVKNGDSKQHDIYLKVTLLDSAGHTIGTVIQNVDNVAGGATVSYAIKGTATTSTWASVQVTVNKVTENTNGSGSD